MQTQLRNEGVYCRKAVHVPACLAEAVRYAVGLPSESLWRRAGRVLPDRALASLLGVAHHGPVAVCANEALR